MAKILYFECSKCGEQLTADVARNVCPKDGGPLYVRYDLAAIRSSSPRQSVNAGPSSMWRYSAVLPDAEPVTLGEGLTPMLPSRKYPSLLIKDEGLNPTGSFKARGMSAALTMARHYGLKKLAAPSAGNAGGALAAYSGRCRPRGLRLYAERCPAGQSAGGRSQRRTPHAGRWADQRLRTHGRRAQR